MTDTRSRLDQIGVTIDDLVARCSISLPPSYAEITTHLVGERVAQIRNLSIEVTRSLAMLQRALKMAQRERP
jgi:hypothetical protein